MKRILELGKNLRIESQRVHFCGTIGFLICVYTLQCLPFGFSLSIPYILSSKGADYSSIGTFGLAVLPFCFKILWSPMTDVKYWEKMGRRKSWIVPVYLLIAIYLFSLAYISNNLLNRSKSLDIILLTVIFFIYTFFISTLDASVDGWALTLLGQQSVTWQSVCAMVGYNLALFVGGTLLIIFESPSIANKLRSLFNLPSSQRGVISLEGFIYFWASVYLLASVLIFLFKNEKNRFLNEKGANGPTRRFTLLESYKILARLLQLKSIRLLAVFILTSRIGIGVEGAFNLKLIEYGLSKEIISLYGIPFTVISFVWLLLFGKYTAGYNQLFVHLCLFASRLFFLVITLVFIYFTPNFKQSNDEFPVWYLIVCFILITINYCIDSSLYSSEIAFCAQKSTPAIGGTFMALCLSLIALSTLHPRTFSLYLIDWFSKKRCLSSNYLPTMNNLAYTFKGKSSNQTISQKSFQILKRLIDENDCSTLQSSVRCESLGGICGYERDAFYLVAIVFFILGLIWLLLVYKLVKHLTEMNEKEWSIRLSFKQNSTVYNKELLISN